MDNKKYHSLDPSIHLLSDNLSLKEDRIKPANEHLTKLLEVYLLPTMKEVDENFKNLFQRVHYSGSYYENLRICAPNEFDLNLELRSQKGTQNFVQICSNANCPGFVQLQHLSSDIIRKWINTNGFVLQNKVLYWLQGVVDKALNKITNSPWHRIWRKTSGPAVTLYVEYVPGEVFSVDLVPVFVFDQNNWPRPPVRQAVVRNKSYALQWCVVPKPNNHTDRQGNLGTFWRISFYNQEKEILNNKNHLKNAFKLMKMLRDIEGWDWLSSYYLKTVYLWTVDKNNDSFWNDAIGIVFMNMMRNLRDYLKDTKSIPFFWDERLNLISSVHPAEIEKVGYRLERVIKDIDRKLADNPRYIEALFHFARMESSDPTFDERSVPHATRQEESSIGLGKIVLGIGALAIGGAALAKLLNTNRNQ